MLPRGGLVRGLFAHAQRTVRPAGALCRVRLEATATSTRGSRRLHQSAVALHGHLHKPKAGEELHITFITKDGSQQTFEVAEGDNILDIAQAHNLDMEGACGGSCACSTCHIIVDPEFYDEIPEPDDDENDMLDLAFGLTETSRLGCQVKMTKELDGIRIALPAMTRNLQLKDFK
jgi:ferredoxin